mmetsp:Transcript_125898/g.268599  ORF Transcript_125898/g.268599 Transcript_125898/m.268599 type:complete len:353 (+) Transcript_125898:996-2054(+)
MVSSMRNGVLELSTFTIWPQRRNSTSNTVALSATSSFQPTPDGAKRCGLLPRHSVTNTLLEPQSPVRRRWDPTPGDKSSAATVSSATVTVSKPVVSSLASDISSPVLSEFKELSSCVPPTSTFSMAACPTLEAIAATSLDTSAACTCELWFCEAPPTGTFCVAMRLDVMAVILPNIASPASLVMPPTAPVSAASTHFETRLEACDKAVVFIAPLPPVTVLLMTCPIFCIPSVLGSKIVTAVAKVSRSKFTTACFVVVSLLPADAVLTVSTVLRIRSASLDANVDCKADAASAWVIFLVSSDTNGPRTKMVPSPPSTSRALATRKYAPAGINKPTVSCAGAQVRKARPPNFGQ